MNNLHNQRADNPGVQRAARGARGNVPPRAQLAVAVNIAAIAVGTSITIAAAPLLGFVASGVALGSLVAAIPSLALGTGLAAGAAAAEAAVLGRDPERNRGAEGVGLQADGVGGDEVGGNGIEEDAAEEGGARPEEVSEQNEVLLQGAPEENGGAEGNRAGDKEATEEDGGPFHPAALYEGQIAMGLLPNTNQDGVIIRPRNNQR